MKRAVANMVGDGTNNLGLDIISSVSFISSIRLWLLLLLMHDDITNDGEFLQLHP